MPKRNDINSIIIIGAGPIVIGQACEFDYSGAQACKALREEGYRVILVNSNPATIMTDPVMADATYIEPITWQTVEQIIAKCRDGLPVDHNPIGLGVNQVENRRGRQCNVRGAVNVAEVGAVDHKAPVCTRVELERDLEGS